MLNHIDYGFMCIFLLLRTFIDVAIVEVHLILGVLSTLIPEDLFL